ncbi:transcriptional regulator ATRX-like isoform X2 [Eurosta solidaginis]|uniref:transcriptional regulator ATRX-like isoform X2 n=1 Tax=Eurosta solidaginis TaxID=178769 RepID=UPI0035310424
MALARDIDQEVSETLCTLLSFDEDNFLSQEEVEENLRNCPNLGHDSALEKIYQDYNSGNSSNNSPKIDVNTSKEIEDGGHTQHEHDTLAAADEEQKQMDQILKDDDQMDTTENDLNISTHNDNGSGGDGGTCRSLENALDKLIAATVADEPTSVFSQDATIEIKSEFVKEMGHKIEKVLSPPPSSDIGLEFEPNPTDDSQPEFKPELQQEPQLKKEQPMDEAHVEEEFQPVDEPQVEEEPQVKVDAQLEVEAQAEVVAQAEVEAQAKVVTQAEVEAQEGVVAQPAEKPRPEEVLKIEESETRDTNHSIMNEHIDVKLEFTCESEQVIEEQIGNDYYIEDEFNKDIPLHTGLTQIEIDPQNGMYEENENEDVPIDLLDNTLLNQNMDNSNASNEECIFNNDDDRDISHIMSDHNYISQEKTKKVENLQKQLVEHILSSKGSAVSMKVVTDFVEKTLESIQMFGLEKKRQLDTIDESSKDTAGILEIFADEKSTKKAVFDMNLKSLATNAIERGINITAEEVRNETDVKETKEAVRRTDGETDYESEFSFQEDIVYKTVSVALCASPQANCSEPLEHSMISATDSINAILSENVIVNDSCNRIIELANLVAENETEQNIQPERDTTTELVEQAGCNDEYTLEQASFAANDEEDVSKIPPIVTKGNSEGDTEIENDAENLENEVLGDKKRIAKIAVFNEELSQLAMEVSREEECDDIISTEEVPRDKNTYKEKTDNETLTDKMTSIADTQLVVAENNNTSDINEFKAMNISSVPSPPEYCSEPLEHTTFDDAFELNCNEKLTVINHLHTLKSFAKSLRDDCEMFTTSTTTIESKLQKYMQEKFEIFKKIVRSATAFHCEEKSIQTDERLSKRKIRKLNQSNKKCLINPTETNSSSDGDYSSTDNSIKSQITTSPLRIKISHTNSRLNSPSSTQLVNSETNKKECIAADYDDGVALVDYTQSEVFETETYCNETFSHVRKINKNDSLSDDDDGDDDDGMESDLEDTWHRKKSSSNTVVNTSTVPKASENESDKENTSVKTVSNNKNSPPNTGDKEIERLINLNGLIKRTKLGHGKSTNERAKAKSANIKNKDVIDLFANDDIQAEIFSDPSVSESEEEITETQFLKRCNENVKKELLSDSNSDVTESDVSDNIEEILSSSEESNSPLVDRFLKKFNVNESDDEEESEKHSDKFDSEKSIMNDTSDFKNNLTDKNKSNSSENSDCEMLDDMVGTTNSKHTKPKSLEKMLSVVEKRKKLNRLCESISLSSESESSSDVEAVEETKSRIKPMLRPEQLATVTREAQRNESERIRRLEKKHKTLAKLLKERPDVHDECNLILDYNDETKTFIKVHPDIVKHLKQHQREGVRFMYDSCYGGIEALKKSSGSGCILAHCMGLGKTLQLIALLHTVISYKELKTAKVLVLCPKSTVMNWADEIERWLGPLKPKYYTFNDTSDVNDKIQILKDWSASTITKAGILLIGYEAFRTLVLYHSYKNRGIAQSRLDSIRNDVDKYLLTPGADLVVCDEGHIIKNSKSAISLAVSQIKTHKRIVLTGTPIQNNLKEYYSMVNFIKPLFLGTEKEFANLYANPIKNGQHKDSSKRDIQVMKQRSFVLHKKLSKFVQRKEAELLKTFLPQKYEYVLFIPMTKVQTVLYEHILGIISKKDDRGKGLITDYTCLRKIWTHPKVLEDAWRNATARHRRDSRKTPATVHSDDDQPDDVYDSQTGIISVTNDWWRNLLAEKDLETILPSNKLRTMFEILRMCEEKGEKCLIFSAFVAVLNVVEYFFKKMNDKDADTLNELKMSQGYQVKNTWILGKDYYRLDGKTPKLIRHEMIEQFNCMANKRARVFLISSRAGGQGINLTGANRVIILDTSWNPSNDQQNIFRVFRLGQKKNCYIYRLIAMGTMEEKVYSRSVTKQAMSFRVVDEQQIDRHYSMAELTELYSLTTPDYENRPMPDCPQDTILASLLLNYPSLVYKYHEHDSLLENKVEQELSEQEKQDAWAAYERDQQMNSEIREMPNPDELQNNIAAPKFPPYLGSSLSAFNQMSALFNYGNFSPATLSPYLPYLSHLNNYTASNQQYLEMRKRLAEGTFPYTDMSASLGTTPYNTPFAQNPPKSLTTNPLIPDMSNLHNSALHTNPLSALGDLSLFGLGNPNNHMPHNVNTSTLQQQQQQQRQHSSPNYAATTNPTAANSMQANFDYQMYENSLKSLVNYRHDFAANGNTTNKSKSGNMPPAPVQAFKNPLYAQMGSTNYDKNAMTNINSPSPKPMEQQQQQQSQKQHTDKNTGKSASSTDITASLPPLNVSSTRNDAAMNKNNFGNLSNSSSARSSPLPQVLSKRNYNDVHIANANEGRLTPNQKSAKDAQLSGNLTNFQSYKNNNNSTTNNSGNSNSSIYTNKNLTTGKTSNDNMNSNKSSMQIIPTTSPPGTSSITKQYTDISPSISLTAVTTTSASKSAASNSNFNQAKNQTKNNSSNKTLTTNNNSNSNKSAEFTKSSTTYATNKFYEMNKQPPPNRPVSKTNTLKSTTPSASDTKSTTATTSTNAQTTQNTYQKNATDIGSKLLAAMNNARNKNLIQKKPQNLTVQQIKSGATTNTARTPTTITAVKTTQNGSSSTKATTTKSSTAAQQSDTRRAGGGVSIEKRLASPNTSTPPQSLTSAQAPQKSGASTSSSLKMQPNATNKSAASSSSSKDNMLTYILDKCINQKKFTIGAPTKGGGGTTVTRVQGQGKRKNTESIPKDAGSNETKRSK